MKADLLAVRQQHLRSRALSTAGSDFLSSDEDLEEEGEQLLEHSGFFRPSRYNQLHCSCTLVEALVSEQSANFLFAKSDCDMLFYQSTCQGLTAHPRKGTFLVDVHKRG